MAADGLLREFAEAGMIRPPDFHLARRMAGLAGERGAATDLVELAFALTARELRLGSVCLDLATAHQLMPEGDADTGEAGLEPPSLPWPDPGAWLAAVGASPAVSDASSDEHRPFRLSGSLLYLDRFWAEERAVAHVLARRGSLAPATVPTEPEAAATGRPDPDQDAAVAAALRNLTTVITGGPGTGKTTIVGRILAALASSDGPPPRVVLMAPTAKAAARLQQSVAGQVGELVTSGRLVLASGTIHKVLGIAPHRPTGLHGADNPLPHDLVVVDETSMVSLSLMRVLLESVADTTRLVLVGDPQQLASVEAGAVLADLAASSTLVTSPSGPAVMPLRRNHRSTQPINDLALAIREGDVEAALAVLDDPDPTCQLFDYEGGEPLDGYPRLVADLEACGRAVREAALRGDGEGAHAALASHRVLCAHREGHHGVGWWSREARSLLGRVIEGYAVAQDGHWAGQPLLMTANTPTFRNGDTAVVVQRDGSLLACVDQATGRLELHPRLLEGAVDLHAMTIHKSQGSQFSTVTVVVPPLTSPLLTRELLYTGVTRAQDAVRLYGTREALARAVATPIRRASGLGRS